MISQPRWNTGDADGAANDDAAQRPDSTQQAFDQVFKHLAEIRDYALLYLETRKDQVLLVVRQIVTWGAIGLLALAAVACALVTAVVLTMLGIANGVATLLDGQVWAGQLITGGGLLMIVALTIALGVRRITKTSRRRMSEKYEQRREELRQRFAGSPTPRCAANEPLE